MDEVIFGRERFMRRVYDWMGVGLGLTGIVAYEVSQTEVFVKYLIHHSWLFILLFLIEVIVAQVLVAGGSLGALSHGKATALYLTYCTLSGVTLAPLFMIYTSSSIYSAFFTTAAVFVAMSIYGYVTHKDLTTAGSYALMVLMGIIISMLVNLFLQSSGLQYLISVGCVIVFTILTAYDTQKIRDLSLRCNDSDTELAIVGALILYLDFINLFIHILQLMGEKKDGGGGSSSVL